MSKKVLVVDDDAMIRKIINAGLSSEGYQLFELTEGSKVLNVIRTEAIDLVVLDIVMEGQEGMQTAFELLEYYPDLPVIIISSDSNYLESAKCIVDATLSKPISISSLRSLVAQLLAE